MQEFTKCHNMQCKLIVLHKKKTRMSSCTLGTYSGGRRFKCLNPKLKDVLNSCYFNVYYLSIIFFFKLKRIRSDNVENNVNKNFLN